MRTGGGGRADIAVPGNVVTSRRSTTSAAERVCHGGNAAVTRIRLMFPATACERSRSRSGGFEPKIIGQDRAGFGDVVVGGSTTTALRMSSLSCQILNSRCCQFVMSSTIVHVAARRFARFRVAVLDAVAPDLRNLGEDRS